MANSNRNGMAGGNLKGHLALLAAYTIFGVNIVLTKDISNSAVVSPIALFTLRAIGASALFWLISLFTPKEKVPIKDLIQIAGMERVDVVLSLRGMRVILSVNDKHLAPSGEHDVALHSR